MISFHVGCSTRSRGPNGAWDLERFINRLKSWMSIVAVWLTFFNLFDFFFQLVDITNLVSFPFWVQLIPTTDHNIPRNFFGWRRENTLPHLKDPKPALNTHDESCLPNVHVPLHATNMSKKSHITQTIRAYSHPICWSLIGANACKSMIIFYVNEGMCCQ